MFSLFHIIKGQFDNILFYTAQVFSSFISELKDKHQITNKTQHLKPKRNN